MLIRRTSEPFLFFLQSTLTYSLPFQLSPSAHSPCSFPIDHGVVPTIPPTHRLRRRTTSFAATGNLQPDTCFHQCLALGWPSLTILHPPPCASSGISQP